MSLAEVDARSREDDPRPPERPSVTHEEEQRSRHNFSARYFRVSLTEENIGQFKLMDPVGKAFYLAGKMRLRSKRALEKENIMSVPETAFDRDRAALVDAISEW